MARGTPAAAPPSGRGTRPEAPSSGRATRAAARPSKRASSATAAARGGGSSVAAEPGRRERTKAANRAAILEAGRQVFAERGYDGSAVRHIVALTDLAPGTFYNYFPDKEAIFRALVEESIAVVRERLREARREARSIEEFVGGAYHAYFAAMAADPVMFQLMRRNAGTIRAMLDDPVLAAGVGELLEDLEAAIARGELPPLDARYMARAMAGAGLEIAMEMFEREREAVPRATPDVEGAAAFATALFLGGIERMALDFKRT